MSTKLEKEIEKLTPEQMAELAEDLLKRVQDSREDRKKVVDWDSLRGKIDFGMTGMEFQRMVRAEWDR